MKKSNVIGLTIGIVVVIVAVSLICWFAIKPVQFHPRRSRGDECQNFV